MKILFILSKPPTIFLRRMSRSIQTPPEEIEDPFENLESQKSRAEDERKLNKLDFAEAGNEIGSTIDGEQSEGQDQDAMKNKVKEGALIGHEAILADIERSMNKFIEEIRTSLQNSKQEEPEQAIKNYNKILHDHLEPQQPAFHGTHPGLAGHRAIPSAIGHSSRAGGPTAPQNIRQATKDLRPKRPSYAQQGSLIFSRQDGSDLAQIPLAERSSGLPSFQSPSRFPGGDVISTQGSLHHSTSNVAEDKSLDSVKEDLLLNTRWRMKKFVAEFICTMFLLLIGTSVQCQVRLSQSSAGFYQSINWAWGFAVLCTIHLAGGISGAHANPGITVALTLLRKFPFSLLPVYLAAQIFGAFIGAAIAYGIYLPAINIYQGKDVRTITGNHETGSLFVTVPDSMATPLTAFFNEFVASAVLGLVVFAVGDDSNSPPGDGMSGLIIGISVTMIVSFFQHVLNTPFLNTFSYLFKQGMSLGWQTGYAVNMARDLGPRILLSCLGYESKVWTHNSYWWLYGPIVGTIAGTVFGCILYDICLFTGEDSPVFRKLNFQHFFHLAKHGYSKFARKKSSNKQTNI